MSILQGHWSKNLLLSLSLCALKFFRHILQILKGADSTHTGSASLSSIKTEQDLYKAYETHANRLLRLAYSYLHNMEDAEDILQECLLRYLHKSPVFLSEEHEKAWLLRVCANLSKNKIDYNVLRQTDELQEELVRLEKKNLSFVWDAVKALPLEQREVIHLYYQEGLSTVEIAKVLGQNESSIRSRLKRARDRLKGILKEDYDFA